MRGLFSSDEFKSMRCVCGCPAHCKYSCMEEDCDCTECECAQCRRECDFDVK